MHYMMHHKILWSSFQSCLASAMNLKFFAGENFRRRSLTHEIHENFQPRNLDYTALLKYNTF